MSSTPHHITVTKFERVSFEQDRLNEARYWASKSIAERVLAAWDLADDHLFAEGHNESKAGTAFTFRRVAQSWR